MNVLDRKLGRDLFHLKGQVITLALVVAAGIAAFVGSVSTYDSLRWLQASYYESARFAHVFAQLKRAPITIADRLVEIAGVAEAETTISYDVLLDVEGVLEPLVGRMIALPDRAQPRMNRLSLRAGRWIDAPESNQVLLNETFANARNLRPGDQVTALLNGKREHLQIVGVVLSPEYVFPIRAGGDERSFGILWIGRKRLAAAFNMEGAFNSVALRLAHDASERAVIDALDRVLEPYGSTGAYGRSDQLSHRTLTQEIAEWEVFGTVLPAVFLGVAVFLLNVVLTRQVGTQRAQIATLKALGRPDWEIGLHYLKFVLVIGLLGSVLGIVAGAWFGHSVTQLYTQFFRFPVFEYRLQPWIPLLAVGIALAAAGAGAWRAILRVVRLPPAEAMQPEAPPVYRATLLERIGLGRLYSTSVRMIVRDIERRPARAIFTTVGIAAAVAILISGTWWGDAIDYMMEVEFRLREREDVGLQLTEVASSTIVYDLMRLPGVLRAETDRVAAVRLRHGHRSYRTAIIGLAQDTEIRLLLDAQLRRVPLPAAGLVVNSRLAERLQVARGDTLRVEFLQGARTRHDVPVVGLVDELMEMQAYMDRTALNRLQREGDAVSGARLIIDPGSRAAFLRQVKETPRIAGAVEIEPMIRHFREITARNILVFTSILSLLAGTIAVGVVYNNVRIALAERAWELASLRVLGFTRGEVSALLLGELAVELLVALPLGWVLGYWLSWLIVALMEHETMQIPLVIAPATYAFASLVVLMAGGFSALILRRRIDRLELVGALKVRE